MRLSFSSPVRCWSRCSALIVLCGALAATAATPARSPWVAAWSAAPQDYAQSALPLPGVAPQPALSLPGQTVRQRLLPGLDGQRVRVRFSNAFGKQPLHIAAASIARSTGADAVSPGSMRLLRFNRGRPDITIAPGAEAWSDAVAIRADAGQPMAVSFRLDRDTPIATVHHRPLQASWIAPGNAVAAPQLGSGARRFDWNLVVTGIDVEASAPARVVVAFGDSITEGTGTSSDVVSRPYPERLGERLRQPNGDTVPVSVLNAGIGGNRLLAPRMGPRGLDRFERDALGLSGVTHVIVLIGINDIGFGTLPGGVSALPAQINVTSEQITDGLQQLIARSRARGVKVLLGTLLPFKGSGYWSEDNEAKRQAVNRWIRGRQDVDAVVDFDAALRDAGDPLMLNPLYDSGDHLHPNDAGNAAMAAVIDVKELLE
jgi:lysophospholipase L1-like esterase